MDDGTAKQLILVLLGMVLLFGTLGIGIVSALTWHVETVDTAGYIFDSSLALDSAGNPHVSYLETSPDYDLKYAFWNGSAWNIQVVDTSAEGSPSMKLDSAGNPRISYAGYDALRYAARNGSAWQIKVFGGGGGGIFDTSLALDTAGNPHIAYYDMTAGYEGLMYASNSVSQYYSNWDIEIVDPSKGAGIQLSLALDSTDTPHICYYDSTNRNLVYAKKINSMWWTQTVDSVGDVGQMPSLALDGAGYPHISYYDYSNNALKYAFLAGSGWHISSVDSGGSSSSLVLDADGNPRISYDGGDCLKYASWTGSTWQIETVDSGDSIGKLSSLALDSSGEPRISYRDGKNADLKYARGDIIASAPNPVPSSPTGGLYVASVPANATILIDGTEKGHTNQLVTNLPAGNQNLTLVKDGYQSKTVMVNVPAGDVKALASITLTKVGGGGMPTDGTGTLYVASIPSGATILINGTDYGTTNKLVAKVPAGNQNLTLTKAGHQPFSTVIDVPVNNVKVLASIALTKVGEGGVPTDGIGTLYVASIPSGATILINGTDYGTTNKFVTGVPAGDQNLTLVKNSYQIYTTVVTVPSGGSKILAPVTLTKGTPAGPEVTSPVLAVTIPAGDEHGPCRITINRESHSFTFTGEGFDPEKRYYLQYTLPDTDGIHTIAAINGTPSGTVQHEGIWTREGSSTPVFRLTTTGPPIALMLFGNYEPVRGWNDYLEYYDWYWTLSTSATWTPPPAGVMIDHYQVTVYGIVYDDRIGTRETKWLGSAEIPPQGIALTPPLRDTFSYIDTLCYSPDFCDEPLIQPPFTASGTIWDSAGNSYSTSMILFPTD